MKYKLSGIIVSLIATLIIIILSPSIISSSQESYKPIINNENKESNYINLYNSIDNPLLQHQGLMGNLILKEHIESISNGEENITTKSLSYKDKEIDNIAIEMIYIHNNIVKEEVEVVEEVIIEEEEDVSNKILFKATAYDLSVQSCGKRVGSKGYGITASGTDISNKTREEAMSVAVDSDIIKLGTKLRITFPEPYEHFNGIYTANDTGSAINGYIVDIFMGDFRSNKSHKSVWDFGVREVYIEVIDE